MPACMLRRIRRASSTSRHALLPVCIFKIEEFKVAANVCKKEWNTVPIYSQHLVFFLFFVGGCDSMVSLYLETGDP